MSPGSPRWSGHSLMSRTGASARKRACQGAGSMPVMARRMADIDANLATRNEARSYRAQLTDKLPELIDRSLIDQLALGIEFYLGIGDVNVRDIDGYHVQ